MYLYTTYILLYRTGKINKKRNKNANWDTTKKSSVTLTRETKKI